MNYQELFSKGDKYVYAAGNNWHSRRFNLVQAWVRLNNEVPDRSRKLRRRIESIVEELDFRLHTLSGIILEHKAQELKEGVERDNINVMLQCSRRECRQGIINASSLGVATAIIMKAKDYEPGVIKCRHCGADMMTDEERNALQMLAKIGIHTR